MMKKRRRGKGKQDVLATKLVRGIVDVPPSIAEDTNRDVVENDETPGEELEDDPGTEDERLSVDCGNVPGGGTEVRVGGAGVLDDVGGVTGGGTVGVGVGVGVGDGVELGELADVGGVAVVLLVLLVVEVGELVGLSVGVAAVELLS